MYRFLFLLAVGCTLVVATEESELCSAVIQTDYEQVMKIVLEGATAQDINAVCNTAGETPLMLASQGRHRDIAELLIVQGRADVNRQSTESHETALMIASNRGNLGIVNLLLKNGKANVNLQKKSGATALMLATFAGYADIVKVLLTGGANANMQESAGNSAILLASMRGYLNVIQVLISEGRADETIPNRDGQTAVQMAVKGGHMPTVKYLLERQPQQEGHHLLREAILGGFLDICELLLTQYNADGASAMTPMDRTPLQLASEEGDLDIVNLLLVHGHLTGTDMNKQNTRMGYSALHIACEKGHDAVVHRLLQEPVLDVDIQSRDGTTALMLAAARGSLNQVVSLVSTRGANVNLQKTTSARMALHFASAEGHERVVYFLVNGGTVQDINARELKGWTALSFASFYGHTSTVKTLLEGGRGDIDVNQLTGDDFSNLLLATMGGHVETVRLLLNHGALPNVQREVDGFNPLIRACQRRNMAIVELLLSVPDIAVNMREQDGWTALMFASHTGEEGIVLALLAMDGIDVDVTSHKEGMTAVMFACQQKHTTVLQHLIETGDADVLITSKGGYDAEVFCSHANNTPSILTLIQSRAAEATEKKVGKWGKYKSQSNQGEEL